MGALEPHRGDFYAYETLLPEDEQKEILRLREFLEHEVRPIADEYWAEAEFPRHLIAPLRDLDLVGCAYEGFRDPPFSRLFSGFTSLEMSRVDPSFGTFFGVHAGLAFASIFHCGSPAQRGRWLPGMADLTAIGAFALTEPDHGSDIAGGLATTARRDGDHWVLNGKKRWIGNGTFADLVVVWARDVESEEILGFVMEKGTLGYTLEREQFGQPLAGFQLVQDHLATMLSNITMSLGVVVRLAQMQDEGIEKDEHAALAKATVSSRMRETVGIAREVMGGNGILLEHGLVRFFADAEAVYSYEGTREVNQLIVGRAITGTGAFV